MVSEALVAGVPIIASDIPGNVGLLGKDYAGYFRVGDEQHLTECIRKAETDAAYLKKLEQQGKTLAPLFTPEKEQAAWLKIIEAIT